MIGWRALSVLREGYSRFRYGRWISIVLVALTALGAAAGAAADASTVSGIVAQERAWIAAGGRVLVVTDEDGIAPARCDAVGQVPAVAAAGATTSIAERAHLASSPDASLRVVGYSPGLVGLLGLDSSASTALLISPETAASLGLTTGSRVRLESSPGRTDDSVRAFSEEPLEVVVVARLERLGDAYAGSILVPVSSERAADTCLIEARAGAREGVRSAAAALVGDGGSGGAPVVVQDRLLTSEFASDFRALYEHRDMAAIPWGLGLLLGVLGALIRWIRRADDALYELLGARRGQRVSIHFTQWALTTLTGLVLGAGMLAVWATLMPAIVEPSIVLSLGWRFFAITMLSAAATTLLTLAIPTGSPFAALRER